MDRARLHAGDRPRLPPRKTRILQPGRFMGRRSSPGLGASGRTPVILSGPCGYFFAVGDGDGLAGAAVAEAAGEGFAAGVVVAAGAVAGAGEVPGAAAPGATVATGSGGLMLKSSTSK